MLYFIVPILALASPEVAAETYPFMQQKGPLPARAYIQVLRDRVAFLQKQNAELKRIVQALEPFREITPLLQQHREELEQALSEAENRNQALQEDIEKLRHAEKIGAASLQESQAQIVRDKELITKLVEEQKMHLAALQHSQEQFNQAQEKIKQAEDQIKQVEEQKRLAEQTLEQEKANHQNMLAAKNALEDELQQSKKLQEQLKLAEQFDRRRVEELELETKRLSTDYESAHSALDNYKAQLLSATQKFEQLQQSQQSTTQQANEELVTLKSRLQSLQRELEDNRAALTLVQKQNADLSTGKTASEQQLKNKTTRLEVLERTYLKSLDESHAMQTRYQATIDEKIASIAKWQQANALLTSQLDKAISLNSELRHQLLQLEAQCKTPH